MRIAAVAAMTLGLAACSMADSSLIGQHDLPSGLGCRSTSGAYYLSKTYFKIKIQKVQFGTTWVNEFAGLEPIRRADRNHGYCLDYLASSSADEKLQVRLNDNFLLETISSEAIDQSGFIVKTLVRTVFSGITQVQARGVRSADKPIDIFDGEWDPINRVQSAVVNATLREAGFCVVVVGATFDLARQTVDSYCNDPAGAAGVKGAPASAFEAPPPPNRRLQAKGVVYRPRVPHAVYLFVSSAPGRTGPWRLAQVASIPLENNQPTVSVGVDRAMFAARKTSLIFDDGALQNICVFKTSELEEIASIPLEVARNLVALPANVVQLKIQNTNNHAALIEAENALIETQQRHLSAVRQHEQHGEVDNFRRSQRSGGHDGDPRDRPRLPGRLLIKQEQSEDWNRPCPVPVRKKALAAGGAQD